MKNNGFPSKEIVDRLRQQYPKGTRVELVSMNDPYTKLILNVDSFTHELLEEKLTRIIVPEHNHLIYEFKDGSSVDVFWQFPSRSLSWNSEMRQAARERTLAKSRKEKKEHETKGYNH